MRSPCLALLAASCLMLACTTPDSDTLAAEDTPAPEGYAMLGRAVGNLDADAAEEVVVVYETPQEGDQESHRELRIYQVGAEGWEHWHTSIGPILSSEDVDGTDDPFRSVRIEDGRIVVEHAGGGRTQWMYVHQYQWADGTWRLAEAAVERRTPCEEATNFRYDVTAGTATFIHADETCDGGQQVRTPTDRQQLSMPQNPLPTMDGFVPGTQAIDGLSTYDISY